MLELRDLPTRRGEMRWNNAEHWPRTQGWEPLKGSGPDLSPKLSEWGNGSRGTNAVTHAANVIGSCSYWQLAVTNRSRRPPFPDQHLGCFPF